MFVSKRVAARSFRVQPSRSRERVEFTPGLKGSHMKLSLKRACSCAIAMVSVTAFAACGSSSKTSSNSTGEGTTTAGGGGGGHGAGPVALTQKDLTVDFSAMARLKPLVS